VYSYSFRSFFDDWSQSSWNIRSEGVKVPQEEQSQEMKVLETFAPEERKFHRSECYRERKFLERSFARNEGSKEPFRKCTGTKNPSFDLETILLNGTAITF